MAPALALILAMASQAWAAAPAKPAPAKTAPTTKAVPVLDAPVGFAGGIMLSPDIAYAALDGFRPLTLDLYQIPSKANDTPRPAIVFVHGGEWRKGDARHAMGFADLPTALAALAARNYVVASVNYRLSGEAHFPGAVQDVKSALRYLREHASNFDIDTTRMAVWGIEAGGQIAALVGTSCGVAALEPVADKNSKAALASDCVQGVVDWGGPTDFTSWDADAGRTLAPGAPTSLGGFLGCEPADCAAGMVHAAAPLSYLESQTPAFLIQQGASDTFAATAQSRKLYDGLQELHVPSQLIVYPGVSGDFTPVADKAMADMEDFLVKTFPPASAKPAAFNPAAQIHAVRPAAPAPKTKPRK